MPKEFLISREVSLNATPEEVWEAVATAAGNAAWLFPVAIDPDSSDVVAWDPPKHFAVRTEQGDSFNALDYTITARDGGTTQLKYVHNGVFQDDWDAQYDAVGQHTDFYLHTLGQYLEHFAGRPATYIGDVPGGILAPASTSAPDGFSRLRRALGISEADGQGDSVHLILDGLDPIDGVIDYLTPNFLGICSADALYCFFGRNAFGSPVGMTIHSFADGVDAEELKASWSSWLERSLG